MPVTSFQDDRFLSLGLWSGGGSEKTEADRDHHDDCRQDGPQELFEVLAVHLRPEEMFVIFGQDARSWFHDCSFSGADTRLP
jgi:hypothetical protein